MIVYASPTGTRRNLRLMEAAGFRLIMSPRGSLNTRGFRYALDNGAWTAFQEFIKGKRASPMLDVAAFLVALRRLGPGADWIALPDIVCGGEESLRLSLMWLRILRRMPTLRSARFMLVVQNGMEDGPMFERIKRVIGPHVGVFVGGDTGWKLSTMAHWAAVAHAAGAWCHVGRVNTPRRIRLCELAEVDSFDGSSATRYAVTIGPIDTARRQQDLFTRRRCA